MSTAFLQVHILPLCMPCSLALPSPFPAPCSPGLLPRSLFSRTSPSGPVTLTLSQPASQQQPSAQPLQVALRWSSCPVPPWLPPPGPKPISLLTAPISFTAEGEGLPDAGCGDTAPPTPVHLPPSRENLLGGWLGKNRCEGTSLQHSARHGAENRGAQDLQPFPCF